MKAKKKKKKGSSIHLSPHLCSDRGKKELLLGIPIPPLFPITKHKRAHLNSKPDSNLT